MFTESKRTQKYIAAELRRDGFEEDDILLFCYLASGFSTTTISTLLEKDKQYIYNRVYRLRGRIADSSAPDKERFLGVIGKG